jgi:polyhydroxyalkanoate synthesis repressor PhaR
MKQKIRIKKYSNRRLYDLEHKCYITQDAMAELIQNGCEVQIFDSKTGEDITTFVLTQHILENEKKSITSLFTSEVLHQLIQYQDQSIAEFFQQYLPNILRSYLDWQQTAQNQFMQWAKLGWSASQYSRDLFMPGLNMWSSGNRLSDFPTPSELDEAGHNEASIEIETLRRKVEALEKRLNAS